MSDEPTRPLGGQGEPEPTRTTPPDSARPQAHAAPPAAPLPTRLGRYSIVRLLGQGGMGTVYEAQQESPARWR